MDILDIRDTRDIHASGALASVNLLKNDIGVEQAQALVKIKEEKPSLKTLCGLTMEETELDFSRQNLNAGDAVLLASDINANGALARVDLSGNNKYSSNSPDFIRPIANALKANTSITEINLSKNCLNAEAATILSGGIKDAKGALVKMTFGDGKPVTVEVGMTEADFSGAWLGVSGAMILAAWLQHKVQSSSIRHEQP